MFDALNALWALLNALAMAHGQSGLPPICL